MENEKTAQRKETIVRLISNIDGCYKHYCNTFQYKTNKEEKKEKPAAQKKKKPK